MTDSPNFQRPVSEFLRTDFPKLRAEMTVAGALEAIRGCDLGERIIYFYVVDSDDHLRGVLPTRRMLTAPPERSLGDLMIRRVVAIPSRATLLDACDLFVLHKFYALPVIDPERRMVGIIDVNAFTEGLLDLNSPEPQDTVFETLGFHASQVRGASAWKAFRIRFPWLLATVSSGTLAAFIVGSFEATLQHALVIAFFLALVLSLADAVGIQSTTLALQALHSEKPTLAWLLKTGAREILTGLLLGSSCGVIVFLIAWMWQGQLASAAVIGVSIAAAGVIAAAVGLIVPYLLRALRLDPKIAAGPITLASADLIALLVYLSLAHAIL